MVIMKTKKILLLFGALVIIASSCQNYLDPWPNGNYDNENIWEYQDMVQGIINRCYDNIGAPGIANSHRCYDDNETVYLDGVTDDAVITSTTHVMRRYAVNSMTTASDPFDNYWDRDYRSIAQCNIFLKDNRGLNTRFMVKPEYNDLVRHRLQGEAFALRAFFQWDLLQKFGGKGTDGQMLGFPIVDDVVDPYSSPNFARNTYDECVAQIIKDCDSAMKWLPLAHRDFLYPSETDLTYLGGKYWNRFDDVAVWGIKANLYLTWASPRFNPGNITARWDSAAKYAKKIIDFKMNVDNTSSSNSFRLTNGVNWFNPNTAEIVFSGRYITNQTYMERMFYPGGFQGNGQVGATQELVDAFGDSQGYPITHASTNYDANDPYVNRDPRFYSVIFYNGRTADRLNNATKPMYTFEVWNQSTMPDGAPGKDASNVRSDNVRTNYYIKKYVYMDVNYSDASIKSTRHSRFIFRWSHFVLNFAEAANHVTGDPTATYTFTGDTCPALSAKDAIKFMRQRKTYDGATPSFNAADPYLDEVAAAGSAEFDEFVKTERRIETCFEGMRFYDLRRWTTGDLPGEGDWETYIKAPVHGADITQTALDTYTYNFDWQVEERAIPSPYNPIPYYEMLRMDKLIQNVGWPTWN